MKTKLLSKGSLVHVALITLVFALGIQVTPAQPPVLLSASAAFGGSTVTAVFNEPLDPSVAEDTFNYEITGSDGSFINVVLATLSADQQTVTLSVFSPFTAGVSYTLVAVFVCDVTFECSGQQSVPISFQGMPPNNPPVANSQSSAVEANTPTPITLTGSDPNGDPLTFMIASSPTHGALSGTPPNVIYTPEPGYIGPDSFTFKVNDSIVDSAPATVLIDVTPGQPPMLLSATASLDGSTVTAVFSEPVEPGAAGDFFNYRVTGSDGSELLVFLATLAADQQTVALSLSGAFTAGVPYTLTASFICDVFGNCADPLSAPITFQQGLIDAGSVWRYLDTGIDPGTAWIDPFFDDTSWAVGPAELGFGDGDEATVINSTVAGSRLITAYFRHTFYVADASSIPGLTLELRRDDGAIVYLNGVEVFRDNMPPGPASYSTLASSVAGDDGNVPVEAQLSSSALVSGANVIAVEVHQAAVTSSDLTFDLALLRSGTPTNHPPVADSQSLSVLVDTPASITLFGSDPDGDPLTFTITSSPTHGALSGAPPSVTYTPQAGYIGPDSFTFKASDGTVDSASATVSINVLPKPPGLVSAAACLSVVTVVFDEALEPFSASNPFNYLILGSNVAAISVVSATLESDQQTVTLITDPSTPFILGVPYTLVASDICDTSGACLSQASVPIQFDFSRPTVTCNVAVKTLFPPNDAFIDVGLTATASEGNLQVRIFSDEPEFSEGTEATFHEGVLRLRARRFEEGDGRVYLIVVTATDVCNGNVGGCCKTVVVPHDLSKAALNSVNAQAAAAEAQCSPQGAPSTPYEIHPGP
jgi:hypothetical protein